MHAQGVPIAVISAGLGHTDPAFTMRTYVHQRTTRSRKRPLAMVLADSPYVCPLDDALRTGVLQKVVTLSGPHERRFGVARKAFRM